MGLQAAKSKDLRLLGKFKQFLATVCMCPISLGSSLVWTSPVLPQFQHQNFTTPFHLTTDEGSWVGSMLAIGALGAAIPAGFLADRFGPKKCAIGFAVPVLVFAVLVFFADNVYMLCVARLFAGIAVGGSSVIAPMYISEIADVSLRGTLGSFFELLIYVGIVTTAILGASMHYITFTVIMGALALLLAIILMFLPESPTYLMKINERSKAESALRVYRSPDYNVDEALDQIAEGLQNSQKSKANIGQLLKSKATVRGLVACVGLTIFQQLSGIDGITFYAVPIFQEAGTGLNAHMSSIIMFVAELLSASVVIFTVERLNRRIFLFISTVGTCISLALFGLYFTLKQLGFRRLAALPLASMILYDLTFAVGLGPIPWMINGELFSPEIKGLANGITITASWTFLFIVTKTMPLMIEDWGAHYTFYTYASFMALCAVFVKFFVPETRGKTLEQIQTELRA